MRYAEIINATGELVREVDQPEGWSPELVAHKFGPEHERSFVPVHHDDEPEYSAATHHLRRLDPVLDSGAWRYGWEVVENPVPHEVPLWAFRAVLTTMGLATQIADLISTLPEPARTVAGVQWEYANFIRRDHSVIAQLAPALSLSPEQVDAIFRQASALT